MTYYTSLVPSASFTHESTHKFWSLWDGDSEGGGDGGACNPGACISGFNWNVLDSCKQT